MSAPALGEVRLTIPSHPKYLPLLRALVQECGFLIGFDEEVMLRVLLAVTEAVTNVIRHAYEGDTDRRIDLVLHCDDGCFKLDIVDYGRFVDPKTIESRPLSEVRPGGLGVHLIKSTMDNVEYRANAHGGTTLTLVKCVPAHEESS